MTAFSIKHSVPTCERLIEVLLPWTSYLIVPVFAFANAGIGFGRDTVSAAPAVLLGVAAGLLVGKCAGITAFAWFATRRGWAHLPTGVDWRQLLGVSILAGIGLTVSLFITGLAFDDDPASADAAKIGILVASVIAAVVGSAVLARRGRDVDG
jgi:NhaA family Na+:H+ antiporter